VAVRIASVLLFAGALGLSACTVTETYGDGRPASRPSVPPSKSMKAPKKTALVPASVGSTTSDR
jgi:hypothetical protein